MPAPNRSRNGRIRIAATSAGPFATLAYVRSGRLERGTEGATTLRWLGGEDVDAGDPTVGGTIPVWWTDDEATQTLAEEAWASGDTISLQYCPKGTEAGKKVKQFDAKITSCPIFFDSEGKAVEGEFGCLGIPSTLETVTLV